MLRRFGRECVGTTTHRNGSSSTDNTIVGKTSCVLCFQQVASRESGVFIGTHTPDFKRVRTDDLAILASLHSPQLAYPGIAQALGRLGRTEPEDNGQPMRLLIWFAYLLCYWHIK